MTAQRLREAAAEQSSRAKRGIPDFVVGGPVYDSAVSDASNSGLPASAVFVAQ